MGSFQKYLKCVEYVFFLYVILLIIHFYSGHNYTFTHRCWPLYPKYRQLLKRQRKMLCTKAVSIFLLFCHQQKGSTATLRAAGLYGKYWANILSYHFANFKEHLATLHISPLLPTTPFRWTTMLDGLWDDTACWSIIYR